jgi:hypothetical protein
MPVNVTLHIHCFYCYYAIHLQTLDVRKAYEANDLKRYLLLKGIVIHYKSEKIIIF